MDKDTSETFEKQADIVMNVVMRLSAIEKLLIDKEVITKEEMAAELEQISGHIGEMITKAVQEELQKANKPGSA